MATYAIGDVQGCYDELRALLLRIGFDARHDRLWLVGDLVNRGPKSLDVLRFVRDLGPRAIAVLGNHDLHLVCAFEGLARPHRGDTLDAILSAPDARALVDWLRERPMMHVEGRYAMVHAGLLPQWTIGDALARAQEVEATLRGPRHRDFLAHMYGGTPTRWNDRLGGWDRIRVIVNAMTRMRFCTRDGEMDLRTKGARASPPFMPWFEARPAPDEAAIVCGHWSALGVRLGPRLAALDDGCVWGGTLAALRLQDRWLVRQPSAGYRSIGED